MKIEDLARRTSGYSGADLASVLRFAVLFAAKRRSDRTMTKGVLKIR